VAGASWCRRKCCPKCHEREQLRYVILDGETRRVCCSVLGALITRGLEKIIILDQGLWEIGEGMARAGRTDRRHFATT